MAECGGAATPWKRLCDKHNAWGSGGKRSGTGPRAAGPCSTHGALHARLSLPVRRAKSRGREPSSARAHSQPSRASEPRETERQVGEQVSRQAGGTQAGKRARRGRQRPGNQGAASR